MKTRIRAIWMIICLVGISGTIMASGIILCILSSPDSPPSFPDRPDYVRVVVYRGPTNAYGGSFMICSETGERAGICSSVLYEREYYYIKKGVYRVENMSLGCKRVMCNGVEITNGSLITFTGGGYVAFQMN